MTTDYHSHILPNIDDGSDSIKTSLKMIKMMKQQGIGIIVATPHFYMHREASLDSYLVKRQNAYEKLMASDPAVKDIHIGAEVAIEKGISVLGELEKLCISGTRLILLEPPFTQYRRSGSILQYGDTLDRISIEEGEVTLYVIHDD